MKKIKGKKLSLAKAKSAAKTAAKSVSSKVKKSAKKTVTKAKSKLATNKTAKSGLETLKKFNTVKKIKDQGTKLLEEAREVVADATQEITATASAIGAGILAAATSKKKKEPN